MLNERNRGLFAQTTSEYTALLAWFLFTTDNQVLAVAVLVFGLFNEHLTSWKWFGPSNIESPTLALLLISVTETVLWIVWLILFNANSWWIAGIFLAVTMFIQHSVEKNLFSTGKLGGNPVNFKVVDFTLLEAAGATGWLLLTDMNQEIIGAIVLFVALYIEHALQTKK